MSRYRFRFGHKMETVSVRTCGEDIDQDPLPSPQSPGQNRGLLDLNVTLSTQDVMAGQDFSMYVLVKNPFDRPIWIRRVHVSVPSEIDLPQWDIFKKNIQEDAAYREQENKERDDRQKKAIDDEAKRRVELTSIQDTISNLEKKIEGKSEDEKQQIQQEIYNLKIQRENLLLLSEAFGKTGNTIYALKGSRIEQAILRTSNHTSITADEGSRIEQIIVEDVKRLDADRDLARSVDLKGSLPEKAALQPGNTAVYTIIMKTKDFLLFRPSQYCLQFSVNYGFEITSNSELFTNTIATTLSIRASLYSVIIGSAIGGLFGALARFLQLRTFELDTTHESIISLALSVILSIAAIIFLARKSGTQAFVSVEDLWGGILIGFLVGYTGVSFFQSLTGVSSQ